jgi:hypothetical protein
VSLVNMRAPPVPKCPRICNIRRRSLYSESSSFFLDSERWREVSVDFWTRRKYSLSLVFRSFSFRRTSTSVCCCSSSLSRLWARFALIYFSNKSF